MHRDRPANIDETGRHHPADNPFSAQRIHPPVDFVTPGDEPDWLSRLRDRFCSAGWVGQIIGPHGSGKTTLAREIAFGLPQVGQIISKVIRPARRSAGPLEPSFPDEIVRHGILPDSVAIQTDVLRPTGPGDRTMLLVDGMNRLGLVAARGMSRHCRRTGMGLLLTVHRPFPGIPRLVRLEPTLKHFRAIVQRLQQTAVHRVSTTQIEAAYRENRGDYRAALFQLYDDWYETTHQSSVPGGDGRSTICKLA